MQQKAISLLGIIGAVLGVFTAGNLGGFLGYVLCLLGGFCFVAGVTTNLPLKWIWRSFPENQVKRLLPLVRAALALPEYKANVINDCSEVIFLQKGDVV